MKAKTSFSCCANVRLALQWLPSLDDHESVELEKANFLIGIPAAQTLPIDGGIAPCMTMVAFGTVDIYRPLHMMRDDI